MKLRIKQQAAIALLALAIVPLLASLLFPHNDIVLYAGISVCAAFLISLIPSLTASYCTNQWAESVFTRGGDEYPIRVLNVKADFKFAQDIKVRLVIAGVHVEVNSSHRPNMFGIPPRVDHVVNIEDCMLLSNDDLVDLLNELYETEYYLEEK